MRTALVTGSAGFVGRHMAAELERRGWKVVGWDIRDTNEPWEPEVRNDCLRLFSHDGRSCYDLVVHCAAQSPHRAAIDGQPATHVYNQLLDAAMFEWAIRTGQGQILYFSSSAAYPVDLQKFPGHRLAECDVELDGYVTPSDGGYAMTPDSTYGWTKLTGEGMAASARAAGVPVSVVRPFSGYGEDQGTDWPFGAFLDRARRREDPFTIWGDGAQVRDWVHIDDVVAGALAVVESGTEDPVNLCTGRGTSMAELVRMMAGAAGYWPELETHPEKPAGVAYRVGDPTRLRRYYKPTVSIEEGVKRALAAG